MHGTGSANLQMLFFIVVFDEHGQQFDSAVVPTVVEVLVLQPKKIPHVSSEKYAMEHKN